MNIIDAVKSGKPFKRKTDRGVYWQLVESSLELVAVSRDDILATDWEIEERNIQVTETELDKILSETIGTHLAAQIFTDAIKKRLFGPRRDLEVR